MNQTIEIPPIDNEQAWGTGGRLPDGWNRVRCEVADPDKSGSGNPQIAFEFSNRHGSVKDWLTITEKSLGRVAQVFKAFGVEHGGGAFNPRPLVGKSVEVLVQTEPSYNDPSKSFPKVKAYRPVEGEDPTPDAAGPPPALPGATTAAPSPAYDDSDIPF